MTMMPWNLVHAVLNDVKVFQQLIFPFVLKNKNVHATLFIYFTCQKNFIKSKYKLQHSHQ